jgi:hypothetical protein
MRGLVLECSRSLSSGALNVSSWVGQSIDRSTRPKGEEANSCLTRRSGFGDVVCVPILLFLWVGVCS